MLCRDSCLFTGFSTCRLKWRLIILSATCDSLPVIQIAASEEGIVNVTSIHVAIGKYQYLKRGASHAFLMEIETPGAVVSLRALTLFDLSAFSGYSFFRSLFVGLDQLL